MSISINRKSLSKRVRVTKRGKVLRKIAGVSHNRMKKTSANLNTKKKFQITDKKIMGYLKN